MSSSTRGVYLHFYNSGEKPTVADLLKYGLAINIPDSVMWTLNINNEPVPLPLSKDLIVTNYLGYKVPLTGYVPSTVPEHIVEGKVKNLADIFTHIYYSRPEPSADSILRKGEMYQAMTHETGLATAYALYRYTENGRAYAKLVDSLGNETVVDMPSAFDDGRTDLTVASRDYRTRINGVYSRHNGALQSAAFFGLFSDVDFDDPDLELVFVASTSNVNITTLLLNVIMISKRTGVPLLNSLGKSHKPLEIAVLRTA